MAGDYIPNAVSRAGSLGLTVTRFGPWSGGLNTRYIGPYPLSQDGTLSAPSAIVSNLHIQRELTPRLTGSFNVLNIFNRAYYDIAYEQAYEVTPTAPVVQNGITVHPGEPRVLRVNLKYLF
jgi:outer membrane receptor protein involved in Fe transport